MSLTPADLRATNIPSPALTRAVQSRPFTITSANPLEFRALRANHLAKLRHLMPLNGQPIPSEVSEHDEYIPVRGDGSTRVRVRIYQPRDKPGAPDNHSDTNGSTTSEGAATAAAAAARPLILMFHEGGFMYGDVSDEETNCRLFARDLGAVCVNVEYRLAPEHVFPTWIEDCWDVTRYFAQHHVASGYGVDLRRAAFVLGGSSAGANIAAVLAMLSCCIDDDGALDSPVTGQYLSVPLVFDLHSPALEKYKDVFLSPWENTTDPVLKSLGEDGMKRHVDLLKADPKSRFYSPVNEWTWPPGKLSSGQGGNSSRLAPAYLQVAGLDPLRDHALVYDRMLREEYGVVTKLDLYPGWGHMFWTNWPECKESRDFVADTVKGMRWLLDQRPGL